MMRNILLASLVPLVASCGNSGENFSRLNPINWIGTNEEEELAEEEIPSEEEETIQLVQEIVDLRLDPLADGAIILASGLPPTQGYSNGELIPLNEEAPEEGKLIYEFRVSAPTESAEEGTPESRQVIALRTVSSQRLESVSTILVLAQTNSMFISVGE